MLVITTPFKQWYANVCSAHGEMKNA